MGFPEQRNHPGACDHCRSVKQRCSGDKPKCERCEKQQIKCVYRPKQPAKGGEQSQKASDATRSEGSPASNGANGESGTHVQDGESVKGPDSPIKSPKKRSTPQIPTTESGSPILSPLPSPINVDTEGQRQALAEASLTKRRKLSVSSSTPLATMQSIPSTPEASISRLGTEDYLVIKSPKAVQFTDLDLSTLSSAQVSDWTNVARRAYAAMNFPVDGVEWDSTGGKRVELRQLVMEVGEVSKKWKEVTALADACAKLSKTLMLFHDFYEQLGACMTSLAGLNRALHS
ncbi:hypothetical protein CC78DRAFT_527847 [Lojkania enalia]|uniref:Zn(2)-C6 fungal-type domain-containing protein n=1 Tax=Lojkania enalia TaxID=147567 RepID=A0A9P4NCQ9_9PLEO|nr:hypothetical protein CC78DRAFT_527847 [Didymosphaeria enalia]